MNGWQIVLEYLRVLAWPLVVVFLVWRFKAQAGRLFDRLLSLKTPVGTAEFDREAREVSAEAKDATLDVEPERRAGDDETHGATGITPPETTATARDRPNGAQPRNASRLPIGLSPASLQAWTASDFRVFRDVAAADPASAVLGAWRRIEQFAHLVIRESGQAERWSSPTSMLKQLREAGLPPHFVQIADDLRRLRNSAAHGGDIRITSAGALDYIDAAERLADAMAILYSGRSADLRKTLTKDGEDEQPDVNRS